MTRRYRRLVLALVILLAAAPPAQLRAQAAPPACPPDLAGRLASHMPAWLTSVNFSGVIVVACHGVTVYSEAAGLANRETGEAITTATRFNLGSMNKMWTAMAVARLVDQGRIDLDAPVGRYLPRLANAAVRDQVRVRHLLNHTSGLGSYFTRGFLRERVLVSRAADYLPFFIDDPLAFTPGARFHYSNAGFALLGAIVEEVSGQSYFDYMRTEILAPAGMKTTAFDDARGAERGTAVPYGTPPGAPAPIDTSAQTEARGGPAGGARATAADVIAFSRAMWAGTLASVQIVATFTTGTVPMGPAVRYALGFGAGEMNGWRHVGHNGGAPGVGTDFLSFPDQGIDIVVLTNVDMPLASRVMARASALVTGQTVPDAVPAPAPNAGPVPLDAEGWPASPMGRRVAEFFTALRRGGDAYAAFIDAQMVPQPGRPASERAKGAGALAARFGAFTLERTLVQRPGAIEVMMKSEKEGRVRFIFEFEPAAPHRISLIDMKPGDPGGERRRRDGRRCVRRPPIEISFARCWPAIARRSRRSSSGTGGRRSSARSRSPRAAPRPTTSRRTPSCRPSRSSRPAGIRRGSGPGC